MTDKLCKDCKWCKPTYKDIPVWHGWRPPRNELELENYRDWKCDRPSGLINRVTGEELKKHRFCNYEREHSHEALVNVGFNNKKDEWCGEEGFFWEKKEETN